ncbi:MAG: PhoH family protein [Anaerorhabdus sp.]
MDKVEYEIDLDMKDAKLLVGVNDINIKAIEKELGTNISYRKNRFILTKGKIKDAKLILEKMYDLICAGKELTINDVYYYLRQVNDNSSDILKMDFHSYEVGITYEKKKIFPKTKGQKHFVEAMDKSDIIFSVGPAGTGKTFLAVAKGATLLKKGDVKRIVLTRPAVEAGESLGFLPGDLKEKVDPYLTPLYDALYTMFGVIQTDKYIEKGIIEIAPLAYMRGRTLDDAFVILDEAQNTTETQMKMFLTRLGFNSKMVINGDITQIDLKYNQNSGLKDAIKVLKDIKEIMLVKLTSEDVVRHPLVQKIIDSYERSNN